MDRQASLEVAEIASSANGQSVTWAKNERLAPLTRFCEAAKEAYETYCQPSEPVCPPTFAFFMPESNVILNAPAITRALTRVAHQIMERNEVAGDIVLIGIQSGGVPLAEKLAAILATITGSPMPCGRLDVSMHRDDLDRRAAPNIHPTVIPFDVAGKTVVLVDDVLFSGRTIRAAMDALNDFGRPKKIQLAVLIDRGHRELPIKADFVGKNVPTSLVEKVRVRMGETGVEDEVTLEKS
jgi:pyrimidine operon attenuation protein/uracil phosphoribosyltransferase